MKTIAKIFESEGERLKCGNNKPVLIDDPGKVWLVYSGIIDLFSVGLNNNDPVGTRLYFFTVNAGEMMFGINSEERGNMRAFLAVGNAETEIISLSYDRFKEIAEDEQYSHQACNLINSWINGMSYGVSKDINPETDLLVSQDIQISIPENKKFRSTRGVNWVEAKSGDALFLGIKNINDDSASTLFPITKDSWAQTIESTELISFSTKEALKHKKFWHSLDYFYELVLFCEMLNTRLTTVDELNRLTEKANEIEKKKNDAFFKIASVINKSISKSFIAAEDNPLITAVRYVANASAIDITLPKVASQDEMTNIHLSDISSSSRFRTRKVQLRDEWWKKDSGPLLAYTEDKNLPVAIIPRGNGKYTYFSSAEDIQTKMTKDIAANIKQTAIQFYRPFPDKVIKGGDLLRFGLKGTRKELLMILLVGISGGLLALLIPVLTGVIFDKVIPQSDYQQLYVFGAAIFVSAIAFALFQLVRSFAMIRIETKIDFQLQAALWDRILSMPVPFFKKFSAGELASKANSLIALRAMLSNTVIYSIVSSLFAVFNYFVLFVYDPLLALITTIVLVLSLGLYTYLGFRIQAAQRQIVDLQNKISGLIYQLLNNISKLKIAGAEIPAFSLWADKFSKNKKAALKVKTYSNIIRIYSSILPVIASLLLFAIISFDQKQSLSTGEFLAFFTAFTVTIAATLQLGNSGISFFSSLPLLENVKPILETLPENESKKQDVQRLNGEIEINNLNFRYDRHGPLVIKDLSMYILPGEYIAIVGESGSGKSTLLRLLLGFESPESGSVYYDRQDLSAFDPNSVRRQAGTVLQESRLGSGNILSNIIGVSDSTVDDAWEAAEKVGLDEDIKQMPMGMFTVITDGLSTLSGGQRQRIMIARAIVSRPRILFLDEATSSLDNETQRIVSDSLDNMQSTRFVIAHRLSTIKNADRIFVMENGSIVEEGNYKTLMEKGDKFAELVKRQMLN